MSAATIPADDETADERWQRRGAFQLGAGANMEGAPWSTLPNSPAADRLGGDDQQLLIVAVSLAGEGRSTWPAI
jgi:hypothetical protein